MLPLLRRISHIILKRIEIINFAVVASLSSLFRGPFFFWKTGLLVD